MFQGHTISQYIYDLRNKVVLESQYLVSKVWIYAKATKESVFDLKRFLSKCCELRHSIISFSQLFLKLE